MTDAIFFATLKFEDEVSSVNEQYVFEKASQFSFSFIQWVLTTYTSSNSVTIFAVFIVEIEISEENC